MRIAIGSDHAGFELKEAAKALLADEHCDVLDVGTYSQDPVDYADFAEAVGAAVQAHDAERGILLCGSGVGASMAANRMPGVRAGLCHDTYSAHQGVEHDDMNVLVLGGRVVGVELARELIHAFLNARFTGEARHLQRLAKLNAELDALLKSDETKKRLESEGADILRMDPAQFARFLHDEIEKWGKVVKQAGITAE